MSVHVKSPFWAQRSCVAFGQVRACERKRFCAPLLVPCHARCDTGESSLPMSHKTLVAPFFHLTAKNSSGQRCVLHRHQHA